MGKEKGFRYFRKPFLIYKESRMFILYLKVINEYRNLNKLVMLQ